MTNVNFTDLHELSFDTASYIVNRVNYYVYSNVIKYTTKPFALNSTAPLVFVYANPVVGNQIVAVYTSTYQVDTTADAFCLVQLVNLLNEAMLTQQINAYMEMVFKNFGI